VDKKAIVKIEVGKFCLDFPIFVAKIEDDCILDVDFLEQIKLGGIFISAFNREELGNRESFFCSRISGEDERIPQNHLEFYKKNSVVLDVAQKKEFVDTIVDFLDIFFYLQFYILRC